MQKFGFIGLGIMGSAITRNLIRAGLDVTVWNRSPDKGKALEELGATVAKTPRAVIEACSVTFAMLADPAAAEAEPAIEGLRRAALGEQVASGAPDEQAGKGDLVGMAPGQLPHDSVGAPPD
jgi:3-hydroxyisobutyrate dehydrogenase-like beta-hydroxyacid dehydrogenase